MALNNGLPQAILRGIKNEASNPLIPEPLPLPTHLPLCYLFTQRGRLNPMLVSGASATKQYGADSFDLTKPWATHQTLFWTAINGNGNATMVQRIKPEDAPPPASLVLWADVLEQPVQQYQRNTDGSLVRDANTGMPIQLLDGGTPVTKPGLSIVWTTSKLPQNNAAGDLITPQMIQDAESDPDIDIHPVENLVGQLAPVAGSRTNGGNTSTRYPIFEFEVDSFGSYGDNLGVRIFPATRRTGVPVNENLVAAANAFIYRIQLLERDSLTSTYNVAETLAYEQYLEFALKPNTSDPATNQLIDFARIFGDAWTSELDPTDPTYGPFGRHHFYDGYWATIAQDAATLEKVEDTTVSDAAADIWLMNLMSGVNVAGNNYYTLVVLGTGSGGINLNATAVHHATGGGDGTMSFTTFDEAVRFQANNFGDLEYPLLDMAQYPISAIWDSGFSLETKYALMVPMSRRKDIATYLCTQDVSQPANTASQDSSICVALYTRARLYPESEYYGTAVCRATVVMGVAELITSPWKQQVPLNYEFAHMVSRYMGASDGVWKEGFGFDNDPLNRLTKFKKVKNLWRPLEARKKDWENGAIYAAAFDMRDQHFPAFQTVFDDDTSTLNTAITMQCCVELEKVAYRAWQKNVGNSQLTPGEFLAKCDRDILDMVRGRFDNRFVIEPRSYYTAIDENNGFSWSCDIVIYANPMRTVGKFSVIARRMSSLPTGQ